MRCLLWFPVRSLWRGAVLLLCLGSMWTAGAAELLAFPSVTSVIRNTGDDGPGKQEIEPALDIFFSLEQASIQLLAEFFVNPHEREVERLQIGIAPAASYKIWIGRFHTPLSYWNTAYHHGHYMQSSITRPGISEYEDEQGVIPMHTTGLLLDGWAELTNSRVSYELALGFGPVLKKALEPVNVLKLKERGKLSITVKLGLQPLNSEVNELGIFAGSIETPIEDRSYTQAKQIVAGVYANQEWEQWRVVGEMTFMRNRLASPQSVSHSTFGNIYVQGEYKIAHDWTGYGRLEETSNTQNPYLNIFPGFIRSRALIGARWEPFNNHAVKFELASSESQDNHRSKEFGMQWSMVFP